eukprot:CAMPEP_0181293670 /NCGR_PEP_ID=MMETSP1101-20121128/3187_1 /TAXON_ID=46948 /ORGANISM="Rhodomonas abbreviata, Strain Caron Lab Isolate" /LENGTH=771 /DNA_ID=CAMNT_0023398269 /DNA_START=35 /DNA_END=2347 /DNA_ORIENTATION=-
MQNAARQTAARGGVHIVLAQEEGGEIFVRSLLRGGQLSRQVRPLDKLVSVNGKEVISKDLSEVLPLVAGPEGSQITFGFLRPSSNQSFVWTVTRTNTELQDIQVAMIEDILALLATKENPDKPGNIYDVAKKNSWRVPGSLEGNLYLELIDQIKGVKRGELKPAQVSTSVGEERLRNELRIAEESSNRLREELNIRDQEEVSAVTVQVKENPELVADAVMRQGLQDALMRDLSTALGVPASRFGVVGMHRAEASQGVNIDLTSSPLPPPSTAAPPTSLARALAADVISQASGHGSPLLRTPTGSRVSAARARKEYEYVLMFKKTVQMLQEELLAMEGSGMDRQGAVRGLSTELSSAQQSVEAMRREIATKDKQVDALEKQLLDLQKQTNTSRQPREMSESDRADWSRRTATIRTELADLQTQNAGLLDDRRRLDEEVARLRSLVDGAAHERQQLEAQLVRLKSYEPTVTGLSSKVQAQDAELRAVLDESARLRSDLERSVAQRQEVLLERDRLAEDCQRLLRQMEPYDGEIRALKDQLQRIPAVEQQNRKLAESLGDLQQKEWRLQSDNDQLKDLTNQHAVRAHTLQKEVDRLREQLSRIKPEDPALRETIARLQQENENLRARLYSMETTLQSSDDKRAAAEGQVGRLREQHETESQRVRAAYQEVERLKQMLEAANLQRLEADRDILRLNTQLETVEGTLRSQHSEHMMAKSKLEAQVQLLDKEVGHHKATCAQLQASVEKLQQENQLTRQEAQRLRDVVWGLEEDKRR